MRKRTVLVTGANGQLGNCIRVLAPLYSGYEFLFTDMDTLDICNTESIAACFSVHPVEYIINCAAYTAVDKAEDEESLSVRINRDAVAILGKTAAAIGAKVIHVSTDYVFDGTKNIPYIESDLVNPVSVYGKSKAAGEEVLQAVNPESVILRTSWLYSEFGNNFMKSMLHYGNERQEMRVVFDQVGTPTYAGDLAKAILGILQAGEKGHFIPGIYHFSNEGVCSWYDFAVRIFAMAGMPTQVFPIESSEYPTRAIRPFYSVLNKTKIKMTYKLSIPHWEESLYVCYKKFVNRS
ncbi:MAG: dTDP-4-dehydrorhamnose reductase [Tannerellaceae bacterium]|nr:dTDP-4-dehydrorhamnose reductase [Tannerellaceae bacterium]